jgi:RimJ/RimL family protein N-acetyltransferase
MTSPTFVKLVAPTPAIAESFSTWENDPALIPFARPNQNEDDLERVSPVTVDDLVKRLEHHHIYLIYLNGQVVGEMDYQIDPPHLYKKETSTAWIGITIGEKSARGRGIGYEAMKYLEARIRETGLPRMELGVFEFNANAIKLYRKLGFQEIGRIENFTYWQGTMWHDIRMEKYIRR